MAEFNLDDLRFPDAVDQVVDKGGVLQITILFEGIGLEYPFVYDMDKRRGFITLVDSQKKLHSIPCKVSKVEEDTRTRSGKYTFKTKVNTRFLPLGDLLLIARTYDLIGQPIPIRQKHRII